MIDIKKIHQIQLSILTKIDIICRHANLNYFLTGGSAIGAVRHQGFIPWDDDIDIGFKREDFEKFLLIAPSAFKGEPLALEENRLDREFEFDFAKVMRTDTQILEHGREDTPTRNGIFIDVFPFDRLTTSASAQIDQEHQISALNREITARVYPKRMLGTRKNFNESLDDLYRHRFETMTKFNGDESLPWVNMSSPYTFAKETILPEEIETITMMSFESLTVPIISGYDSYLKRLYGDYLTLPPINKRVSHHIEKMRLLDDFNYPNDTLNEIDIDA